MSLFKSDPFSESSLPELNEDTDPTIRFSSLHTTENVIPPMIMPEPAPLFKAPPAMSEPTPIAEEKPKPTSTPEPELQASHYGVEKIIRLVRASPSQDSELVISIIIKTLESTGIDTHMLLADAIAKEDQAQVAIQKLEKEIQFLEAQMNERRQQIDSLSVLQKEFTLIKDKIALATQG